MSDAIPQLKKYFEKLYSDDRHAFGLRYLSFELILAAAAKGDTQKTKQLINQAIRLYDTGIGESRYAKYLEELKREINHNGIASIQAALQQHDKQEFNDLLARGMRLVDELQTYINDTQVNIRRAQKRHHKRPEALNSFMGVAKHAVTENVTLKLFGSTSMGGINIDLSNKKMEIAKQLSADIQELIQDAKNSEHLKPVGLAFGIALHLRVAAEAQKEALKLYSPGTAGELGELIKGVSDYLKCHFPRAVQRAKHEYKDDLKPSPRL